MRKLAPWALAAVLLAGAAGVAAAQQTPPADPMHSQGTYKRTVPDSLLSQVKVSEDSARALALTRIPNGMVQALVLERQRGKLVWAFAIRDPAKSANTEVVVNALDGSILKPTQKSSS